MVKNFLKGNWLKEPEFRKYFRSFLSVYILLILLEVISHSPLIGGLGSFVSIVFLILFGRVVYKNKKQLRHGAVKWFWAFIVVLILFVWFGRSILGTFVSSGLTIVILWFVINILFWLTFLLFWGQERSLPNKGFAYVAATSVYMILASIGSVVYYFS